MIADLWTFGRCGRLRGEGGESSTACKQLFSLSEVSFFGRCGRLDDQYEPYIFSKKIRSYVCPIGIVHIVQTYKKKEKEEREERVTLRTIIFFNRPNRPHRPGGAA